RLPEIHRARTALVAAGLKELVEKLEEQQASEEAGLETLRYAWLQSIVETVLFADPTIAKFAAEAHERIADEFRRKDRRHIETTAGRVRRLAAERATRTRDQFREEESLLQKQASLKRRHMPVRDLFERATDVLLALKPCWAMSPLVVSQLLPAKAYFDVVIFDEASQIPPADAVSSIVRGQQLVVAGDEKQLPPTAFFVSEAPEDEEEDELEEHEPLPLVAGTQGFESILDALGSLLRFRMLLWHYRSRDERLI